MTSMNGRSCPSPISFCSSWVQSALVPPGKNVIIIIKKRDGQMEIIESKRKLGTISVPSVHHCSALASLKTHFPSILSTF
jgi:hypothetical protein